MACIKVKPWGKDQGDYVLIEEEDFDPKQHKLHEDEAPAVSPMASGGDGPQKPKNKA